MNAALAQSAPPSGAARWCEGAPLSPGEFASLIDHLGPFEAEPAIAVGVSGGPDSLALAILLAEWAAARGGKVHALTVDHGLRIESAAEARQVGAWLAGRPGIAHHILRWEGAKPTAGLQAKARTVRYRLMTEWCRDHGIRHLAVAHHLDDQIETHLMRRAHGSGDLGLAGMSALREIDGIRLLRPLLRLPKSRLAATLTARGQAWIEDPSNRDRRFERVRVRAAVGRLDRADLDRHIALLGARRAVLEAEATALLNAAIALDPAGYAVLMRGAWIVTDAPVAECALRRLFRAVGGQDYAPGSDRLADALAWLRAAPDLSPKGWTLGGCALGRRQGQVLVSRDWGSIRDRRPIATGETLIWDRRFRVFLPDESGKLPGQSWTIARLGEAGLRRLGETGAVSFDRHPMPESARKALPALWDGSKLLAVPHLGVGKRLSTALVTDPRATSCGFTVAYATTHTMYGNEK